MDEDEKLYLTNKHRGGESGRRGNLYEAYYAVFAIFREIGLNLITFGYIVIEYLVNYF